MKIAVYAICCNEIKNVEAFMESIVDANHITIVDTGSTDHTVEQLKTKAIRLGRHRCLDVQKISIKPFRFDVARNVALALVPDDVDVCIKLDLDETMDAGWRQALEAAWTTETTRLEYDFNYTPTYRYKASWIHSRHGFTWKYPVHEILWRSTHNDMTPAPGLSTTHHKDLSKSRSNYLPLLQMAVDEDPCSRNLFYLCREYYYHRAWKSVIDLGMQYLKSGGKFIEERQDAMSMIADSHYELGSFEKCAEWYRKAIKECPWMREPLIAYAKAAMDSRQFALAVSLVETALKLTTPSKTIFVKVQAWGRYPYDLAAACAFKMGDNPKGMTYVQKAMAA